MVTVHLPKTIRMITVKIKWSGSEYPIEQIPLSTTVLELKQLIKEQTGVLPNRQKLCGISLKGFL